MKMKYTIPAIVLAGALGASSSLYADNKEQSTIEGIKQEGQELLQAMEKYSEKQKTKAIDLVDENLDRMDARIDYLERRLSEEWGDLSKDARNEISEQLAALRKQRLEVAEWYGSLKQNSGEAWNELKEGFSASFEELSQAWEDAEESFEESS